MSQKSQRAQQLSRPASVAAATAAQAPVAPPVQDVPVYRVVSGLHAHGSRVYSPTDGWFQFPRDLTILHPDKYEKAMLSEIDPDDLAPT